MLILVYGCTTTRELYVPLADYYSKDFDYITVHTTNTTFELHEFEFSNLKLEGIMKVQQNKDFKTFHIYVNTVIDLSPSKHVVIERKNIKKITYVTGKLPEAILASMVILSFIALLWGITASSPVFFTL